MAVLKELNLTVSTWECVAVLKELILTLSTLGRCGSHERTDFNSFYFGKGMAVLKELILTVSTLQGFGFERCVSLERTDFNSFYFARVWQS